MFMTPSASRVAAKTPRREKSNCSSSSESDRVRDPVNVYCRLRTLKDEAEATCIHLISPTVLSIQCPTESKVLRKDYHYAFKHIFTSYASQKEVFEHVAYPLLEDLLKGKNGLLFTYGVTGSGKTYTLTGDPYNPGIMPRCIDTIFNTVGEFQAPKFVIKSDRMNGFEVQAECDAKDDRMQENRNKSSLKRKAGGESKSLYTNDGTKILGVNETNLYAIFVSYTEIYNNTMYDLLDESSGKTLQSKILREDANKNMYINGVVEVEVKSAAETFELFNFGQKRKRMGHTILNAESSRSHSIFTIRVVQLEQVSLNSQGERVIPDRNLLKVGQLSLVDLAGSERTSRTQNTGMRLKEASSINNSLMSLRSCMEILRDNQLNNANRLVPYRDSRLTLVFKNYFEGEGKVQMIVCINPSSHDYEENLQVMKFAELTQDVKVVRPESRYTPYRKVQKVKATPTAPTPSSRLKTAAPIVFGPKIEVPKLDLENIENYGESMKRLLKTLYTRREKSFAFNRDLDVKISNFRKRLMEIDQEFTLKSTELNGVQLQLRKERKKIGNLEVKVLDMEKMNDSLEGKNGELNGLVQDLRRRLDEKDLKLNQNVLDRQKQRHKMILREEKINKELDEKLRKQRDHLNARMYSQENKILKMRQVLESNDDEILSQARLPSNREPSKVDPTSETQLSVPPVSTATYMQMQPHTPSMARHRAYAQSNRRRSRSAGDVWLEHNSVKPVPLGTVLQPAIKKRKSVTKLSKASDITNSKQSKYCLIAQEPDIDGDLETKVYKADIVPTCGGGAQVIFNDVECLRQESPVCSPRSPK